LSYYAFSLSVTRFFFMGSRTLGAVTKEPVLFLILSLLHPNVPVIFKRRLAAPYAVFDIQMTTLFFLQRLTSSSKSQNKKGVGGPPLFC